MDKTTKGAIVDEMRQCSVDGFFACGNVLHVHDLVDNVSDEAEIAGKSAALYAKDMIKHPRCIHINPKKNVRYCLPQLIRTDLEKTDIYYRVTKAIKKAKTEVLCDNKVMKTLIKPIVTPGEMEKITITIPQNAKEICVNVTESEGK